MDIFIDDTICNKVVNKVIKDVVACKKSEDPEICVYINSIGGETDCGFAIYELLKLSGKLIKTYAVNEVMSAAVIIYLAGVERYASSYSQFMIHETHHENTIVGADEILTVDMYEKNIKELKEATTKYYRFVSMNTLLTMKKLQDFIKNAPDGYWYFDSKVALKFGIAHKIGLP